MTKTHTKPPNLRAYSCFQSWESWSRENQLSDTQVSERHLFVADCLDFPVLSLKYERLPQHSLKASDSGKAIFSIIIVMLTQQFTDSSLKERLYIYCHCQQKEGKLSSDNCSVWGHNKWKIYFLAQF